MPVGVRLATILSLTRGLLLECVFLITCLSRMERLMVPLPSVRMSVCISRSVLLMARPMLVKLLVMLGLLVRIMCKVLVRSEVCASRRFMPLRTLCVTWVCLVSAVSLILQLR